MQYTITFDEKDFPILSSALSELPYKYSAPLIDKINSQIFEQQKNLQNKSEKPAEEKAE